MILVLIFQKKFLKSAIQTGNNENH